MLLRLLVVCGLFWGIMNVAYADTAHADVRNWPMISQVIQVGTCIVADAGAIGQSAVRHAVGFGTEVAQIVGQCVVFVLDTVTPDSVHTNHE